MGCQFAPQHTNSKSYAYSGFAMAGWASMYWFRHRIRAHSRQLKGGMFTGSI